MNNIFLCLPTAMVLLSFVGYASFCKKHNKINLKKITILAIDILIIFWQWLII
jgi:hypothetical protein